jgi:hypothetical protein
MLDMKPGMTQIAELVLRKSSEALGCPRRLHNGARSDGLIQIWPLLTQSVATLLVHRTTASEG